jgi:hypothetical protein
MAVVIVWKCALLCCMKHGTALHEGAQSVNCLGACKSNCAMEAMFNIGPEVKREAVGPKAVLFHVQTNPHWAS